MVETEERFEDEEEIELMDILLVIWKRKIFIICFTALIVITSYVYLLFSKNIYRISMIAESNILENNFGSKDYYFDSAKEIKALIDSNLLNNQIINKVGLKKTSDKRLSFKVKIQKPTNQIAIALESPFSDEAIEILKALIFFLSDRYRSKLVYFIEKEKENIKQIDERLSVIKKESQFELADKNENLEDISKEILFHVLNREVLESEREYIKSEIFETEKSVQENEQQKVLLEQKKAMQHSSSESFPLETLLILNSSSNLENRLNSQQNLIFNLKVSLSNKKRDILEEESIMNKLNYKKQSLERHYQLQYEESIQEKKNLELSKELIQHEVDRLNGIKINNKAIRMIKEPSASSSPVKPKKKFVLLIAVFLGLFVSFVCAFIMEYFKNYNNRQIKPE